MVPDIVLQKRTHHQANSLDSSVTPSPVTDSSATNSPATPNSFSPTPSPESQSSNGSASYSNSPATYGYYSDNNGNSNYTGLTATTTTNGNSNLHSQPNSSQNRPQNGHMNGYQRNSNGGLTKTSQSTYSPTSAPTSSQSLPISFVKNQLLKNIQQNESIIIIGETGCGKTTQIPKYIYEFYATRQYQQPLTGQFYGQIGITQPRRVAATSIATRVAQEMGSELGQLVGYSIRFEDTTSERTRIKYMTDGILLREAITDPTLSKYRVIILDEAHERTVHTDVLFGVVKKAQRLRNSKRALDSDSDQPSNQPRLRPLKLIIMSATMDVDHFSRYFNQAPVYYIVGRTYPIEILYTQEKQTDYVSTALATIFQIHQQEDELEEENNSSRSSSSQGGVGGRNYSNGSSKAIGGDIIVFCTGQEEIESMIKTVQDLSPQLNGYRTRSGLPKTLKAYPLYAALPSSKQQQMFTRNPDDCFRRVIFSTNIAETSVTIPNIRFVIDTGKVKSRIFSAKTGFEVMQVEDISRAQASQRSGRAGRLAPGQCYRLYTKKEYKKMAPFPIPDIQKCNLANILLQLMAIGIKDVANFDFVDPPARENINVSLESLLLMKAIEETKPVATETSAAVQSPATSHYALTELGKQMVTFPVDPRYSALIIASKAFHCTDEILVIIAMLSVDSIFYVPSGERDLALKMHRKFASSEGDLIKLLNVYRRYKEAKQSREWCHENYLRPVQLRMAVEIRAQLADLCTKLSIPVVGCGNTETIRRCIAVGTGVGVGLGANVASLQRDGDYRLLDFHNRKSVVKQNAGDGSSSSSSSSSRAVFLHPSSCLFATSGKPECVLFVELVHTTKSYMRNLCLVDQQWLLEYRDQPVERAAMPNSRLNTV